MISTPYFQVGSRIYFNKFQAYRESVTTNQPLHFNLYEEAFDQVSWREPKETWDQLLDRRAKQIAAMGRPIILSFSGGTDSYTMFQVFRRNKIAIRAIYTKHNKDRRFESNAQGVLNFFHHNLDDIDSDVIIHDDTSETLNRWYSSRDWWHQRNALPTFGIHTEFPLDHNPWLKSTIGDDFIQVSGLEKPRIEFNGNVTCSYQEDNSYLKQMGDPRYVCFYITPDLPELHVKQSHILARYIKSLAKKYGQSEKSLENVETLQRINYLNYAIQGCGRFGDLVNSHEQKYWNRYGTLYISDDNISQTILTGRYKFTLEEGVLDNKPYAINYLQGMLDMRRDTIMHGIFKDSQNYCSIKNYRSKSYPLDFANS